MLQSTYGRCPTCVRSAAAGWIDPRDIVARNQFVTGEGRHEDMECPTCHGVGLILVKVEMADA